MPIPADVTRFVALVDVGVATQDYAPFQSCIRLVGVSMQSFEYEDFNSEHGCETFLIDLAVTDFTAQMKDADPHQLFDAFYSDAFDAWLSIDFRISAPESTNTYAYELFTGEEPTWLAIRSVSVVHGPAVSPPPLGVLPKPSPSPSAAWELTSFHVGQGMCALLQERGGPTGYLLDAGAGTPVRRQDYQNRTHAGGRSFQNDLWAGQRVPKLKDLWAVVSHPDSDHWRLLDWDSALRQQVKAVYLPSGVGALPFKSPHIKGMVSGLGTTILTFTPMDKLELLRSQPAKLDRNGDCLVALVQCATKTALLSGDYVYDRMRIDAFQPIKMAMNKPLHAVVVPHHGDTASALALPTPAVPLIAYAFFSAGTHSGYGHPTAASLSAHSSATFKVIDRHTLDDIIEQPLIP